MARILIVDDSPTDTLTLSRMLEKHGHEYFCADDGNSAISIAQSQQPDIILMDVVMPELNGYQATRKLSQHALTAHIPIVLISSKNQESDRVWGLRQGAKAYLNKPAKEAELMQLINEVSG